jgi:hypothetical protein
MAAGFWNFGLIGALLVASAVELIAAKLGLWYRNQRPLLTCTYLAFLGTFAFGMFYGLQPFVKALEIALVLAWCMKLGLRHHRKKLLQEYEVRFMCDRIRKIVPRPL